MEYYKILNVNEKSTMDEIKRNYRKLSLKYHPDKGGNKNKFNEINNAYKYLTHEKPNKSIIEIKDNIEIIKSKKIQDILTYILEINIIDSYNGGIKHIDIERKMCENNIEKERIYVDIPKGIDNNEIIIIKDKGNLNNETMCYGILKLFIKINNDSIFERNGMDLILLKSISLKDALCGFDFKINHLNSKQYNIKNYKNVIKPEYEKKIKKLGMIRNENYGDLIIKFKIIFPDIIDDENIIKLQNIL